MRRGIIQGMSKLSKPKQKRYTFTLRVRAPHFNAAATLTRRLLRFAVQSARTNTDADALHGADRVEIEAGDSVEVRLS